MEFCSPLAYQLRGEQRAAEYYRRDGEKLSEEHKHDHGHDHGHEHDRSHEHGNENSHQHGLGHGHDHGHAHDHSHDHKTRFHDTQHAAEIDRRTSEILDDLAGQMGDM